MVGSLTGGAAVGVPLFVAISVIALATVSSLSSSTNCNLEKITVS